MLPIFMGVLATLDLLGYIPAEQPAYRIGLVFITAILMVLYDLTRLAVGHQSDDI